MTEGGTSEEKPRKLVFYPFAYALFTDDLTSYCWYCLKPDTTKKHCTGCGFAIFCDKECQTLGWKDHKAECKGFRKAKTVPDIETRLLGRIVLRYKTIYTGKDKEDPDFYKDRQSKRNLLQIWSHDREMSQDPSALKKFEEIYNNLKDFYEPKFMLTRETVWQLHCRNYINRHALCEKGYIKEIGKGLYLDLCQYDHSCKPNTIYTCDGFVATLRALNSKVDLRDTKSTTYTYIDLLNPVQQRRKELKDTWYFMCECERCTDPQDNLLSAIFCPNCPLDDQVVLCIFGKHSYKDNQTLKITCPKCDKQVPNEYVAMAIETMRSINEVFTSDEFTSLTSRKEQLDYLNEMFRKYTRIFPPTNVFLGKVIQGIIERVSSDEDLLRLHIASEPCVRLCFPENHPAIAFHVRNIGIFLQHLGRYEESIAYFKEADDMLTFVLEDSHPITVENRGFLKASIEKMTDKARKEKFEGLSIDQRRAVIEEEIKKYKYAQSLEAKKAEAEKKKENGSAKKEEKKEPPAIQEGFEDMPALIE